MPVEGGVQHRQEIEKFSAAAKVDGVRFYAITYQQLISRLAKDRVDHPDYLDYVAERYL